jgi:hypothetical protein
VPRRVSRSRWLGLLVSLVVALAWAWFLHGQLSELQQYPWELSPPAFALAIGCGALYFGGLAWSWALLLHQISAPAPISQPAATRVWLLSMMTRYIPGNVWHILSRVAMAGSLGASRTHILTSATIEQVLTIVGALALTGLTLPLWGVVPGNETWLLVLLPLGLVLLHPRILGALMGWAATRFKRPELAWHYRYRTMVGLVLAYAGANLWAGLALYVVLWGLTPVSLVQLPLVVGASALAWVVGYLSFLTPSGLGVREAVLVALLALVFPQPVAIVGSLLFRLVATLGELLALLAAWTHGRLTGQAAVPEQSPGAEQ